MGTLTAAKIDAKAAMAPATDDDPIAHDSSNTRLRRHCLVDELCSNEKHQAGHTREDDPTSPNEERRSRSRSRPVQSRHLSRLSIRGRAERPPFPVEVPNGRLRPS